MEQNQKLFKYTVQYKYFFIEALNKNMDPVLASGNINIIWDFSHHLNTKITNNMLQPTFLRREFVHFSPTKNKIVKRNRNQETEKEIQLLKEITGFQSLKKTVNFFRCFRKVEIFSSIFHEKQSTSLFCFFYIRIRITFEKERVTDKKRLEFCPKTLYSALKKSECVNEYLKICKFYGRHLDFNQPPAVYQTAMLPLICEIKVANDSAGNSARQVQNQEKNAPTSELIFFLSKSVWTEKTKAKFSFHS